MFINIYEMSTQSTKRQFIHSFYQVRNKCQETGDTPPLTETTCKAHTPQITLNLWIFLQLLSVYMYVLHTMRSEKVWLPLHQSPLRQMNQTHLSSLLQSIIDTRVMTPRSLINPDTDIWELNVELLSKQQLVLMALLIMWEWDWEI